MTSIQIRRHELRFLPDCSRVLIRPFIPGDRSRLTQIIGRALALSEEETERELEIVRREFSARHRDLDSLLLGIYRRVEVHVFTDRSLSTFYSAPALDWRAFQRGIRARICGALQSFDRASSGPVRSRTGRIAFHHEPTRYRGRPYFVDRIPHGCTPSTW